MDPALPRHDIDILRHLAARKVELADSPANRERREAWYRLDAGAGDRPMVLIELGGLRDGSNPFDSIERACTDDWARGLEHALRAEQDLYDVIRADLRETLAAAAGCRLEIIMKDVHTLSGAPERTARRVELAREEITRR